MASPRIQALTGIRAVAAIWVAGFHFSKIPLAPLHLERAMPALHFGYLGVDLFFILSGFIICYVHQRDFAWPSPRSMLRFYGLRLARMYPVHLLTLCGLAVALFAGRRIGMMPTHPEDFRAIDFVYNLLLIQSWGVSGDIHWNFPAWSISCEWFAYLAFPLLVLGLNRIKSMRQVMLWFGIAGVTFALAYIFIFNCNLDLKLHGDGFGRFALARVCFEFSLGALLYTLTVFIDMRDWPWTPAIFVGISAAIMLTATPARDFVIVAVFATTILAAAHSGNIASRVLNLRPLVYLGEISYSLYMVHAPISMTLGKFITPYLANASPAAAWVLGICFCLVTLGVAATTYHLVEAPARHWLRRYLPKALPDRISRTHYSVISETLEHVSHTNASRDATVG